MSRSSRGRSRCRGPSHQATITKLLLLSRSSRGRSRCHGRSHRIAITILAAALVVVAVAVVQASSQSGLGFPRLGLGFLELKFAAVLPDWEIHRIAGFAFLHWLRISFNYSRKEQ